MTAGTPQVNTSTSELSYLVSGKTLEALPLNGRNYTDLALLQPGVLAYPNRDGGSVVAHGLGHERQRAGPARQRVSARRHAAQRLHQRAGRQRRRAPPWAWSRCVSFASRPTPTAPSSAATPAARSRCSPSPARTTLSGTAYYFNRNDALDARNFFDTRRQARLLAPPVRHRPPAARFSRTSCSTSSATRDCARSWAGRSRRSCPTTTRGRACCRTRRNPGQFINVGVNPAVAPYLNEYPRANGPSTGGGIAQYTFGFDQTLHQDYAPGPRRLPVQPVAAALRAVHLRRRRPGSADGLPAVPAGVPVAQPVLHRRASLGALVDDAQHVPARVQPDSHRPDRRGQHLHAAAALRARGAWSATSTWAACSGSARRPPPT